MALNFFELLSKYSQFKKFVEQSKQDPRSLLEQEIKRRNLTPQQVEQLQQMAQMLQGFLKIK